MPPARLTRLPDVFYTNLPKERHQATKILERWAVARNARFEAAGESDPTRTYRIKVPVGSEEGYLFFLAGGNTGNPVSDITIPKLGLSLFRGEGARNQVVEELDAILASHGQGRNTHAIDKAYTLKWKRLLEEPGVMERVIELLDWMINSSLAGKLLSAPSHQETNGKVPEVEREFDPGTIDADNERRLASVKVRQGQPAFRKALLEAYGQRCAISGCATVEVLEAAHIYPHRGDDTQAVTNGILLRSDLHTLFDLRLLNVEPTDYRIVMHETLKEGEYGQFDGQRLNLPANERSRPSALALRWRERQGASETGT